MFVFRGFLGCIGERAARGGGSGHHGVPARRHRVAGMRGPDRWQPIGAPRIPPPVAAAARYLYVVGGYDGSIFLTVARLELSTGVWSAMPSMGSARANVCVATLEGILFAIGGTNGTALPSVERCDMITGGALSLIPSMCDARQGAGAAAAGKFIYVVGGADISNKPLSSAARFDLTAWLTFI